MARVDVRAIRREQILDAVEGLVAQRSWARTTFADICRAAGVSNGVLTYHFKDKDDILLALFARRADRWRDRLPPPPPAEQSLDEWIAAVGHEAGRGADIEPELYLLLLHYLSHATHEPELAVRLRALFAASRRRVAAVIAQAGTRGHIQHRDPETAASVIQSLILGVVLSRVALGTDTPADRLATDVAAMVRCYLADPQTAPPSWVDHHDGGTGVTNATGENQHDCHRP